MNLETNQESSNWTYIVAAIQHGSSNSMKDSHRAEIMCLMKHGLL